MRLIVGLGNPGNEYANTRHNVGFLIVDALASSLKNDNWKSNFKGKYIKTKMVNEDIILLKPETYMNLSGESVRSIMDFFHIQADEILVIYDDVDLVPGALRIRSSGSSGGHNGMKSIISHIGTTEFKRFRIGIGKDAVKPTADHVLSNFTKEESELIKNVTTTTIQAIQAWLTQPFEIVMNKFNTKHEKSA